MGTQRSQLDLFSAGAAPPPAATRIQQVQEEREDSLEALTRECVGCQRCDLATTRTRVVISRGNPLRWVKPYPTAMGQSWWQLASRVAPPATARAMVRSPSRTMTRQG